MNSPRNPVPQRQSRGSGRVLSIFDPDGGASEGCRGVAKARQEALVRDLTKVLAELDELGMHFAAIHVDSAILALKSDEA